MTKETNKVISFIKANDYYLQRVNKIRTNNHNIKDFTNNVTDVIMELINREKPFYGIDRRKIEIHDVAEVFF